MTLVDPVSEIAAAVCAALLMTHFTFMPHAAIAVWGNRR